MASQQATTEDKPLAHIMYKHDHVFRINNFTEKMKIPPGASISSPFNFKIKDKDSKWWLECYPNGLKDEHDSSVVIFIAPLKSNKFSFSMQPSFTFSIVDKEGSKKKINGLMLTYDIGKKILTPSIRITHGELLSDPSLLPDDVLTIHCTIGVLQRTNKPVLSPGSGEDMAEQQASIGRCVEDFGAIFLNGRFSDFTVSCQGKEYKCHKSILAQRSTYFDAMLSHDMAESQNNRVELKDLEADTAKDILTFIYTGKVNGMGEKAADLLDVADRYGLPGLKKLAEVSLCGKLNISNVLDMLVFADLHNAPSVRSLALKFAAENIQDVISQEGWRKKMEKYPGIISDILEAAAATNLKRR